MTVLLVDDQLRILSGLISGLDWNALGVTNIRTASDAAQAKRILLDEAVDLLLCDIEMPRENGLSLLRWARNKGMSFVCVFLTSHANFLYAKEAIQLGCFDYILQPAPYHEIQATVARAIARIRESSADKELYDYGKVAKSQEAALFQNLFSDWIAGRPLSIHFLQESLSKLGKELRPDSRCFVVWGHLLRWHAEPWPTQEWVYAMNNIMAEFYENGQEGILPFSIDRTSLGWFVYSLSEDASQFGNALELLNQAYLALSQSLPCDIAFYVTPVISLDELNEQGSLLLDAKQNNVLREKGIFRPTHRSDQLHVEKLLDTMQLRRWEELLTQGLGDVVEAEAMRYLGSLVESGSISQKTLKNFWIQFQQTALNAARQAALDTSRLIAAIERGGNAASLSEIQSALQSLTACFPQKQNCEGNEKNVVDQAKKYVENNLDLPLSVNDVAAALYMNADYLSRVFKNEIGTPLKEYIIQRKMESARLLLTTTKLPVSVIASKLGYDNFSYFSQVYRRCIGISPSDERKKK